ncbi:YtfJ family protein [Veronia nyctiphanis]|uniref:YtfJ family protein n=1 Tax=Veronia nyctiphanis TaxID=1278244 RepID=A0A4V1LSG0_9GAMM|nr:YtfJ family protein [Veronia nyctiphanis]RXJ71568.1 YtfJ family protein [Veronia nyctiphanis]
MRFSHLLSLAALFCSSITFAHNFAANSPVASVVVKDKGELILSGDKITYSTWDSSSLTGKVRVIQAIAGRSSAKELNAPMIEAIKAADLPKDKYQTTTIINKDDAIWGTGGFVTSSAEDSKREFSWSSIVLDAEGSVAKAWQLKKKSSAIIVLDQQGNVRFAKDGELTQTEIAQAMEIINALL